MFKFKAGDLLKLKDEYLSVVPWLDKSPVYFVVKADVGIVVFGGESGAQRYYSLLTDEQICSWGAVGVEATCMKIGEEEE